MKGFVKTLYGGVIVALLALSLGMGDLVGQVIVVPPGGGSSFDQDLNTDDDVAFNSIAIERNLGPELLTNGTFTGSKTGWTGASWTYAANAVTHSGDGNLSQTIACPAEGHRLFIEFEVTAWTMEDLEVIACGSNAYEVSNDGPDGYGIEVEAGSGGDLIFDPSGGNDMTITEISVKLIPRLLKLDGEGWFDLFGVRVQDDGEGHLLFQGGEDQSINFQLMGSDAIFRIYSENNDEFLFEAEGRGNMQFEANDGSLYLISNGGGAMVELSEDSDTGSDIIKVKAPNSITTSYTFLLPPAPPTANGQPLVTTTAGVASFLDGASATCAAGVATMTVVEGLITAITCS